MTSSSTPAAWTAGGAWYRGFAHFTDDALFGQVWPRTELSPKERSLVTVSVLTVGFTALGAVPGPAGNAEPGVIRRVRADLVSPRTCW